MRITLATLLLFVFSNSQGQKLNGEWRGHIGLNGQKLGIILHFDSGDSLSGTMDIPVQNAKGLTLSSIDRKADSLFFNVPDAPGNPEFKGLVTSDSITGDFIQMGRAMPLLVGRYSKEEAEKAKEELSDKIAKIRTLADSLLLQTNTAGAGVGIWYDGKTVLNEGFGWADIENETEVDSNTIFAIGSSSKAFTAMILAMLVEEGKLNWDDHVVDHVPHFRLKDEFATREMTPIDLLTHQSGLPRHDLMWYGSSYDRNELLNRLRYLEPTASFRSEFQYQNLMFMCAGVLAERIEDKSWEELVDQKIFTPLGMSSSSTSLDGLEQNKDGAIGYEWKDDNHKKMDYRNIDAIGPAGSINSTSTDMLKWVSMFMESGKVNGKEIVGKSTLRKVTSPHVIMQRSQNDPALTPLTYGLGWMVNYYQGHKIVQHGGNIDGFSALVFLAPQDKLGMVILTNKNGSSYPSKLSMSVMDIMVDDIEGRDWLASGPDMTKLEETKEDSEPIPGTEPHFKLEEYAGKYNHPGYGTIKFTVENDHLRVQFNSFDLECKHWHYEVFRAKMESPDQNIDFVFRADKHGTVYAVETNVEPSLSEDVSFKKLPPPVLEDEEHVDRLTGEYDMAGIQFEVIFEGEKLFLVGQGNKLELTPLTRERFAIKDANGFVIEFVFDKKHKHVTAFKSHQPNGTFTAKRVEED